MRNRAARPRVVLTNSKFASYNEPTILPYNCNVDIVKCRRYKAGDILVKGGGIVDHLAVELYAKTQPGTVGTLGTPGQLMQMHSMRCIGITSALVDRLTSRWRARADRPDRQRHLLCLPVCLFGLFMIMMMMN